MQTCEFLPPFPPFFLLKNSNFATAQKKRRGWSGHVGARALIFSLFLFSECVYVCVCVFSVFVCRCACWCVSVAVSVAVRM